MDASPFHHSSKIRLSSTGTDQSVESPGNLARGICSTCSSPSYLRVPRGRVQREHRGIYEMTTRSSELPQRARKPMLSAANLTRSEF
jgi:hypothetical protein